MAKVEVVKKQEGFFSSRFVHIAVLIVGLMFLSTNAFHGAIWFDESYSVAIARYSFSDIWTIGSSDVHPVLFYWALHILYLVFGENLIAYRLFTIAGALALALLGLTHIRKDFGWRVGLLFSFLALFSPYIPIMAVEIRMYSWATFTVMVCALYAYRIFVAHRASITTKKDSSAAENTSDTSGVQRSKTPQTQSSKVPWNYWVFFFVSSLASVYLHYYAMLCVFAINIMLFAYLLKYSKKDKGDLVRFIGLAILQILAFLPWLIVLIGQLSVVSNTYWAKFYFPISLIELMSYPVLTSQLAFATRGAYGQGVQILVWVLLGLLCVVIVSLVVWLAKHKTHRKENKGKVNPLRRFFAWATLEQNLPYSLALCAYLSVLVLAGIVAVVSGSSTIYYRYMFVGIGPLLFFIAGIIVRVRSRLIVVAFCTVYLALAIVNQTLLISDDYSETNQEPLTYFEQRVQEVDMIVSSDIGFEGVTAVVYPEVTQYYLDWQKGNWGEAYRVYAPALVSVKVWESIIPDFHGRIMLIGTTTNGSLPRAVNDFTTKFGATLIESQTFFRPYERLYFTVAILEKS